MKKPITYLMSVLLVVLPILSSSASAADREKDEDRLRNSGTVLKEILDVPDDIPQDLLDKADCVVVFPSVLKAAFIVGGGDTPFVDGELCALRFHTHKEFRSLDARVHEWRLDAERPGRARHDVDGTFEEIHHLSIRLIDRMDGQRGVLVEPQEGLVAKPDSRAAVLAHAHLVPGTQHTLALGRRQVAGAILLFIAGILPVSGITPFTFPATIPARPLLDSSGQSR